MEKLSKENRYFLPKKDLGERPQREQILSILECLPDEMRVVAVLYWIEGLTPREISIHLALSEHIIDWYLAQARALQTKQILETVRVDEAPNSDSLRLHQLFVRQLVTDGPQLMPPPLPVLPQKNVTKNNRTLDIKIRLMPKRVVGIAAVVAFAVMGAAMFYRAPFARKPSETHLTASGNYDVPMPQNGTEQGEDSPIIAPSEIPLAPMPPVDESISSEIAQGNDVKAGRHMPKLNIKYSMLDFTIGECYSADELCAIAGIYAFAPNGQRLSAELLQYNDIDWENVGCYRVPVYVPATDTTEACLDYIYINVNPPKSTFIIEDLYN